jgi:hypothetical protein
MRVVAAVLVACVVLATQALTPAVGALEYQAPTGLLHAGANYFSLPALPASLLPGEVFAGLPIQDKLAFWCRLSQEWYIYPVDMSVVDWHMGYRLQADGPLTFAFQGTQPSTELSTCLNPLVAGRAFISQPYDHESYWRDFRFGPKSDPSVKVTMAQAVANGWIDDYLTEGSPDSGVRITADGAGGTRTTVRPWSGYWVRTKVGPETASLMIYWPTQPARITVAEAKRRPDGSVVAFAGAVVTAAFSGFFYIEDADRSSGIRVEAPAQAMDVGMAADIIGTIQTRDGERYIAASTVR